MEIIRSRSVGPVFRVPLRDVRVLVRDVRAPVRDAREPVRDVWATVRDERESLRDERESVNDEQEPLRGKSATVTDASLQFGYLLFFPPPVFLRRTGLPGESSSRAV